MRGELIKEMPPNQHI